MSRAGWPARAGERLDALLAAEECAALLVVAKSGSDPDIAPFVRGAHLGRSLVVAPRGAAPRLGFFTPMEREEAAATGLDLLTPERLEVARLAGERPAPGAFLAGVLAAALGGSGVASGRIALAGHPAAGELLAAVRILEGEGWTFADGNGLVRRFRQEKAAWEVVEARRVAAATCEAFRRLASRLAAAREVAGQLHEGGEPLTVARLRREVALVCAEHGLEQPSGNLIAPGEEGGVPHNTGTPERVLRPGETLIVDLFPKGLLYADCTRTFCVGPVPEAVAAAHAVVAAALTLAHREARPGRRGWDLQEATCAFLAGRGYPTPVTHPGTLRGYVHGLGHGVGHELHEYPAFTKQAGAEGVLGVGDLVTLEPGLYEPGEGGYGIRLEDMVWFGPGGPENLTPLPYDLDPAAWGR